MYLYALWRKPSFLKIETHASNLSVPSRHIFHFLADSGFVTSVSSVPTPDSSTGINSISPKHSGKKLTCHVVHQAWKECYLNQPQHLYAKHYCLVSEAIATISQLKQFSPPPPSWICLCSAEQLS